jgi:hypothetical protein
MRECWEDDGDTVKEPKTLRAESSEESSQTDVQTKKAVEKRTVSLKECQSWQFDCRLLSCSPNAFPGTVTVFLFLARLSHIMHHLALKHSHSITTVNVHVVV